MGALHAHAAIAVAQPKKLARPVVSHHAPHVNAMAEVAPAVKGQQAGHGPDGDGERITGRRLLNRPGYPARDQQQGIQKLPAGIMLAKAYPAQSHLGVNAVFGDHFVIDLDRQTVAAGGECHFEFAFIPGGGGVGGKNRSGRRGGQVSFGHRFATADHAGDFHPLRIQSAVAQIAEGNRAGRRNFGMAGFARRAGAHKRGKTAGIGGSFHLHHVPPLEPAPRQWPLQINAHGLVGDDKAHFGRAGLAHEHPAQADWQAPGGFLGTQGADLGGIGQEVRGRRFGRRSLLRLECQEGCSEPKEQLPAKM